MKRRILTALSLASLLGTTVAWAQGSRGWGVAYSPQGQQRTTTFFVVDGWAYILVNLSLYSGQGLRTITKAEVRIATRLVEWTSAGRLRCPLYVLCAIFALWPAMHLYFVIKHRANRHPNHCSHCGYDLTGNISGTCPECGEPASRATELPPPPGLR